MESTEKKSDFKKIYQQIFYGLCKRHIYSVTSSIRTLPNFFVIGVMRSGTTSLYHNLDQHPCITKSAYDEIGYFDTNFELGINWYRSFFPTKFYKNNIIKKHGKFLTYDVTPFYIYHPYVAKRIYDLLPDSKFITILRNPIDRAYSNYFLTVRNANQKLSFEEIINEEIRKINENPKKDTMEYYNFVNHSLLARGFYAEQLEIWFKQFNKSQFLVLKSEEYNKNTQNTLEEIFQFLELPSFKIKNIEKHNVGKYPQLKSDTRKMLIDFFKPYNEKLYEIIGTDMGWDK